MLNMNFDERVVIHTHQSAWIQSPMPGVWRKPLAREEAERGHATSIVKYDPGASFRAHGHPLGEEIFVLAGTFSDETGNYAAGTYFRNPPGFTHAPFSSDGCVILVKLHQFQHEDTRRVVVNTHASAWQPGQGGLEILPLHKFEGESVALVKCPAGERFHSYRHGDGEEIFILEGALKDKNGSYPEGTWLRGPDLSEQGLYAESDTVAWLKTGHFPR